MTAQPAGFSPAADVIVLGGGIIGSSVALRLAQAGLRVTVFDRGEPGAEASSAAAGMVAPQSEKVEPDSFFELCLASHNLYPDFVAEMEDLSGSHVDYRRDGCLLLALDDEESRELDEIYETQKKLGLPIERLSAEAARRQAPGLSPLIRGGLFLPQDHWVDNELLTRATVRAGERQGVTFFAGTVVRNLNVRQGRLESVDVEDLRGPRATFPAGHFVLAAGCWSPQVAASVNVQLDMQPCRGQMIEFESPKEFPMVVRAGHHYVVPRSSRRLVLGTTAEYVGYKKSVTAEGMASILAGATRLAPLVRECTFRRAWAGLRPDTADHRPILGCDVIPNLVFATGHFRNGILLAPITAHLVSELVLTGSTSRSLDPYRPGRFHRRFDPQGRAHGAGAPSRS
ncbi:MAG TPA: glycine oxidase ThiO [Terriglobia bacterium]|nr:glycine oxidase ThiO [Terriglobia bacterium]